MIFSAVAQPCVDISRDSSGRKQLVGIINRSMVEQDTSFSEFSANGKWYTPPPQAVEILKAKVDSVFFVIIFGTWCHDSQNLIPQFLKWSDAAGFPERRITLFAVDRAKKVQGNIAQLFNVKNTPTFIVMHNGKEAGRVVEYGKSGNMVAELAAIVEKL